MLPDLPGFETFKHHIRVSPCVGLYDRYLAYRVRTHEGSLPEHVALIITERDLLGAGAFDTLGSFLDWTLEYEAGRVTIYVSVLDPEVIPALRRSLEELDAPRPMAIRDPEALNPADAPIQVSIGLGGKHEFAAAVRGLAEDRLAPDDIDAEHIENRLIFPAEPDLMIKTGAERLSDFMIWQSVYSELYFTDVNWQNFRYRDYLRALLSYKQRSRRFGR